MKEEHADTILAALRPMLLRAESVATSVDRSMIRVEDGAVVRHEPGPGCTIVLELDGGSRDGVRVRA